MASIDCLFVFFAKIVVNYFLALEMVSIIEMVNGIKMAVGI
jgi:hypothetical protein